MVKVSITLPNNAQITFESEEPEVIHEIVGMVLRDLPRDLMFSDHSGNGQGEQRAKVQPPEKCSSVASPPTSVVVTTTLPLGTGVAPPSEPEASPSTCGEASPAGEVWPEDARLAFTQFCQAVNPVGDMRRVVVAAEGASRFLGMESVDTDDLGRLFDLAGWRRPHSFVQTLRNSARSKFRWLERVPGRRGRYSVTDVGRAAALKE
jgi:hypothetical protein